MSDEYVFVKPESMLSPLEKVERNLTSRYFMIQIPNQDSMSVHYKQTFGMPTVGDPVIDRQMHGDPFDRYANVREICNYFKAGVPIKVLKHSDTYDIYEVIQTYLHAWRQYLEYGANTGDAPIQELIDLDRLASEVFGHASAHFGSRFQPSGTDKFFKGGWGSRASLSNTDGPEQKVAPRQSLAQLFSQRAINTAGHAANSLNRPTPESGNDGTQPAWMRR